MNTTRLILALTALGLGAVLAETAVTQTAAVTAGQLEKMTPEQRIDALVEAKLKEKGIKTNAAIDDPAFLRRAYLDIAGRIPTIEEAEKFLAQDYPNKREQLIENLLKSEGHVSHFYNYWADVLRINQALGNGASQAEAAYVIWLKNAIRTNMPYDQFVRELVSSQGNIWDNGAVGYYQKDRGMPLDNMSNTVRVFLGTRLECAQCHNHPFDKWTQMDYYKMAAFSYGMDANGYETPNRKALALYQNDTRNKLYREAVGIEGFPVLADQRALDRYIGQKKGFDQQLVRFNMDKDTFIATAKKGMAAMASFKETQEEMRFATGELYRQIRYITVAEKQKALKLPHDYQYTDAKPFEVVTAATMFGEEIDLANVTDGAIDAYAKWMTAQDNPTFTKVIANRLWKKVFGLGIIEPVDELTDLTQPSNPELMAYLESLMKELKYDTRAYLQILYNTKTYQRRADANELVMGEPYYFQGPILRRMSAEQIWDSIVALALPEADQYSPRLKGQLASIERIKQMYEVLENRSPEDYIAMTQELGKALSDNLPKQDEVRKEMYQAREEDRTEDFAKLRLKLRELEREASALVADIGFKHTGQKIDGGELLAAMGMTEMSMQALGQAGENQAQAVLTSLPRPKMPEAPAGLDRDQRKKFLEAQRNEYKNYTSLVSTMARASELQSPAPRGHFLREFGQSDREVIENAADSASVPQALNLLNGSIVESLTNEFAVFGSRLAAAGNPEDKTKMIFQAMLTRQPTEKELKLVQKEVDTYGDSAYEGVVWALLNTQQFLFVQ